MQANDATVTFPHIDGHNESIIPKPTKAFTVREDLDLGEKIQATIVFGVHALF